MTVSTYGQLIINRLVMYDESTPTLTLTQISDSHITLIWSGKFVSSASGLNVCTFLIIDKESISLENFIYGSSTSSVGDDDVQPINATNRNSFFITF